MKRLAAAACLALACAALPRAGAQAQSIDDFLAAGYNVVRNTSVVGSFQGCQKDQTVVFADGSRFLCGATRPQYLYAPRVIIMRKGTDVPSVVLVGGRPLKGALVQMGQQHFAVPLNIQQDPLDLANPPALPQQTGALQPIAPVRSINDLQAQFPARLTDAQGVPYDSRANTGKQQ